MLVILVMMMSMTTTTMMMMMMMMAKVMVMMIIMMVATTTMMIAMIHPFTFDFHQVPDTRYKDTGTLISTATNKSGRTGHNKVS